jgi:uncharacterized protein involved in exopolysaccharide biosynthesis
MQVLATPVRTDPAVTSAQSAAVTSRAVTSDQINSEVSLLQGSDLMRGAAGACGLANKSRLSDIFHPGDSPSERSQRHLERAGRQLGKKIKVELDKQSDVIDVTYGTTDGPGVATCVLQKLGNLYLAKHMALRRQPGSSQFFTMETDTAAKALRNAELRLENFSSDAGGEASDLLRTDKSQQLAEAEAELDRSTETVAADEERIKNVSDQMRHMPERAETQETENSAGTLIQQLEASLLQAELRRSQLAMKFDPSYPLVVEADQEIAATNAAISLAQKTSYVNKTIDRNETYELLKADLAKTYADLASRRASVNALEQNNRSLRQQLAELDRSSVERAALQRDVKTAEASYFLYLAKRDQEKTSDAMDLDRMADVKIAVPPVEPILTAYSPILITILGIIASMILGASASFVAEYLDPFLRTPDEVTEALNVRVLAAVPRYGS